MIKLNSAYKEKQPERRSTTTMYVRFTRGAVVFLKIVRKKVEFLSTTISCLFYDDFSEVNTVISYIFPMSPSDIDSELQFLPSRKPLHSKCPYCGSSEIVTDISAGDIICTCCAMIVGDKIIDDSAEWRCYSNDDGGSSQSSARTSGVSDSFSQVRTIMTGGDLETRQMLQRCSSKTVYNKLEAKVMEYVGHLNNIGLRLGLNNAITVSFCFIVVFAISLTSLPL